MSHQPIDEDDGRSRKRKRITTTTGGEGWWLDWVKTRLSFIFGATNSNRPNPLTSDLGSSMDHASGSSSSHSGWSFDVFLSFRGEDTRANFTSHLDMALRQRGINVFIDNKLPSGEKISTSLLETIEGSRISIVIISKNYASSSWCLDELVKIIECKNFKGQMVLPIFFKVDPSDVRKQTGTFGDGLTRLHDQLKSLNIIKKWKEALAAIAHLSGLSVTEKESEAEIIQQIVKKVMDKLNRPTLLEVAKYPVGIEDQVTNLVSLVMSDGITMLGIYGIGGIGKTTLAKALYNKIANQFEGCSFVANVREASKQFNGLLNLQEMLLSEILMGDFIKIGNLVHRNTIIRDRLHSKRILLVLDDIDDYKQLEILAGKLDWFGHGSKIIVTTRNTHLISEFDKLYLLQGLSFDKALELFSWHAFKKTISDIPSDYLDLSKRAVDYCKGLPLGLEVLGSFLYNRDQSKWKSILDSYEKSSLDKRIQEILQISYNGLEDEIKELFLDISCLFVGEHIDDVKMFLEACGSYPEKGIRILTDLLLLHSPTIFLHHFNRTLMHEQIQMHDLIQQMGRTIALSKSSNPRKRKRLFVKDDVEDVLNDNKETGAVKAIKLNFSKPTRLDIDAQGFRNVKNLIFLKIHGAIFSGDLEYLPSRLKWIDWPEFPLSSFPLGFTPRNVIKLNLPYSFIKHLGGAMNWESLKQICLRGSKFLTEIPDFSTALNLERVDLQECTSLVKVHESVGSLGKLVYLNLMRCRNLKQLPSHFNLKSLEKLQLSRCVRLEEFPHIGEEMKSCVHLTTIFLVETNIKELPLSIVNLTGLRELFIILCRNLTSLPLHCLLNLEYCSIIQCFSFTRISCPCPLSFSSLSLPVLLPNIHTLQLSYCNISDLSFLEILPRSAPFLACLDLSGNQFSSLPCCMLNFESLVSLDISDCVLLEDISKVPECIHQILAEGCILLAKYPDNIADLISYNLHYEDEVEFGYREFVLVNWDIPEWYSYKKANSNNSITFWMSDDESRKLKALAPFIVIEGNGHQTTSDDDFPVEISVSVSANGSRQSHCERFFHYVSLCAHMWLLVFGVETFTQMDEKCNQTNEREIDVGICFKVLFEIIRRKEMVFIKDCGVHLIYEDDDDQS